MSKHDNYKRLAALPFDDEALTLINQGYRKTSNKYGLVSRIDRPDWVEEMAKRYRRAPADFYAPGDLNPAANWCDHYRRVFSKDTVELGERLHPKFPSSSWDSTGYVEKK